MTTIADKIQSFRKQSAKASEDKIDKQIYSDRVLGWSFTDLDNPRNFVLLIIFRLLCAVFKSNNMVHPDEYWQATQVAYNWVYGGVSLPWEFHDLYKLRNVLYPAYLAAPLYLMKLAQLDTNLVVRLLPYLSQFPLVILNDLFIWKLGKKTVGFDATRFAMILIVFNFLQLEYISRCFTNSIEQILSVIAFYFFLKEGSTFTANTVFLTALITIAFIMRNTSIVGWIPLLAIKCSVKAR